MTRALVMILAAAFATASLAAVPSFRQVKTAHVPSESWLLDRQGEVIDVVRLDRRVRRLPWVSLRKLSPAMVNALIASEDRRFLEHSGVDWKAMVGAMWDNLVHGSHRGASTLSMQLVGLLDPSLARGAGGRTIAQKWEQIQAARALEQAWTKEQILEAYVNRAGFRGELSGINAAARGLFGKHPSGLNAAESAVLAALLRGPNADAELVAKRACGVSAAMPAPRPTCPRVAAIARGALAGRQPILPEVALAPHIARKLLNQPGEIVQSTLDGPLQRFAIETLRQHLAALHDRNVEDGAVVVLDNRSGEVLAYVGSSVDTSDAPEVDGASAPRQAGSTLKPFLYSLALERKLLTAASPLEDSPLSLETPEGQYLPQNYEPDFKGWVSVRTALASSLNVPAVRVLLLTGLDAFHGRLLAFGLTTLTEPAEHYGYALALGGADVRLIDLTDAYRALANRGRWKAVAWKIGEPGTARRAADANATAIVTDILADPGARALTFGLDNALVTRSWSAVKTGTSKDMRDNWCIGFTDRFTVGVWVGNFSGASMHDVSGVTGAAPVWQAIVDFLHRDTASRAPRLPKAIVVQQVRFEPEIEPAREELFLADTATDLVRLAGPADAAVKIVAPGNGAVIALDPDIPPSRQRVWFEARPWRAGLHWQLDGESVDPALTRSDHGLLWPPAPGGHRISVADDRDVELDAVYVEVRGTPAP